MEIYSTGDVQVTEGEDAQFHCNTTGTPTPTVTWLFISDSDTGKPKLLTQTGATIYLPNVQRSQAGKYTCIADNDYPPFSSLDLFLSVDFVPSVNLPSTRVSQSLGQDLVLECQVTAEPFPEISWLHHGEVIPPDGDRRYVEVYQESVNIAVLTLIVKDVQASDFGPYSCSAENLLGKTVQHLMVYEQGTETDSCNVDNIKVQENFDLQKFTGVWQRIKTTKTLYADNTYISETMVFSDHSNGRVGLAYRGYSPLTENCVDPGIFLLDTVSPGQFTAATLGSSDVLKVVYTDYDNAVVYKCTAPPSDGGACPPESTHIEIISRYHSVPASTLQLLELYVEGLCVDVGDMLTSVPGLCHFPDSFALENNFVYNINKSQCSLDNIRGVDLDLQRYAGSWYPIAATKTPLNVKYPPVAEFIADKKGRLNTLFTSYDSNLEACLTTDGTFFTWDENHDWLNNYFKLNLIRSKVIFTDYSTTIMYSCLRPGTDGYCAPNASFLRILSKQRRIPLEELRRLKKYAVDVCVDVNNFHHISVAGQTCQVPANILQSVKDAETNRAETLLPLGCKLKFIPVASGLTAQRLSGTHYTVYSSSNIAPDNQHGPVYIDVTNTGGMVILHSPYNEKTDTCDPVQAMVVPTENKPGNYSFDRAGAHVISQLIHIDDDNHNAVIYKCFKVNADGFCDPKYQFAKILSRDRAISPEKLLELKRAVVGKCVDIEKLKPVVEKDKVCTVPQVMLDEAKSGSLPQGFTMMGCMLKYIKVQPDIDLKQMLGAWNTILTTNYITRFKTFTSRVGHVLFSDNKEFYVIRRSFNQAWRSCTPPVVLRLYPTSTPGHFTFNELHRKGTFKIIYTDYSNSVLFICFSERPDGTCDPQELFVTISSRKTALSMTEIQELQQYVTPTCIKFDDMIFSAPGHCPIPREIVTAVQQGEIQGDFTLPLLGCDNHVVPVQKNLDISQLYGKWNHLYRPHVFMGRSTASSKVSHFLPIRGGLLRLWRGFNDSTGLCRPTEAGAKYEASGPGDYFYAAPHFPVIFKIVFTDYTNAVTLSCYGIGMDGKCLPGRSLVEIISKNSAIDSVTLDKLFKIAAQSCAHSEDLAEKMSGRCEIPPSLIDSARAGEVTEEYTIVQCKSHLIPVQHGFDVHKFTGKWNTLKTTSYIKGQESITSHQRWITLSDKGQLVSLQKKYIRAPVSSCGPTDAFKFTPTDRAGHYNSYYFNTSVILKVIYTDYTTAVAYFCFKVDSDGTCDHNFLKIEILSRYDSISDSEFDLLRHYAADSCANVDDLIDMTPELCHVEQDLVQGVQHDQVHLHRHREPEFNGTRDTPPVGCLNQFTHIQNNFDSIKFDGVWHNLASTDKIFKENSWNSSISKYVHENGKLYVAYKGFAPYLNKCTKEDHLELIETGVPGNYTAYSKGGVPVYIKIVATDYTSSALLYTCVHVDHHGYCVKDNVEIAVRDPNADLKTVIEKYREEMRMNCINEKELVPKQTELCPVPHYIGDRCSLADIKVEEKFQFLQLTGLWFQLSRTRFTQFNKFDSSMFYYSYEKERNLIHGGLTGTLNGICQSPISSVTKTEAGKPDGYLLGKMGDTDSIYPWISFRVVYFDGFNLVFYGCYHVAEDGTCMADQIEVSVFGRTYEEGTRLKAALPELMSSLCLSESDLKPVTHVDCLYHITGYSSVALASKKAAIELPDVSGCKLPDIKTANNIHTSQLLGIWYGIASVDYGSQASAPTDGFVVRIARLTPDSFKIHRQQDRNGTCHVVSDVIAKPVCADSTNGDYLSTTGSHIMTQWTTLKILYVDDNVMLLYWCQRENNVDACNIEGVRVDLLSRTPNLDYVVPIQEALRSVCLESKHLVDIESSALSACHPETLPPPPSPPPMMPISSCAVDRLPKMNIDMDRIAGYWYQVASPKPDPLFPLTSMVVYYHPHTTEHMKMIYSGKRNNGECSSALHGDFKIRCTDKPDGRYLGRINMTSLWTFTSMHILFTDYDHVAIAYSCLSELEDGSCKPAAAKALLLSRTSSLDDMRRRRMNGIIYSACLEALEDSPPISATDSCKPVVASALEDLKRKTKAEK